MFISFKDPYRVLEFSNLELQRIMDLYSMCLIEDRTGINNNQLLLDPLSIIVIRALYDLELQEDLIADVPDEMEQITRYLVTKGQIYYKFYIILMNLDSSSIPNYLLIQQKAIPDNKLKNCILSAKKINIRHPYLKTAEDLYGVYQNKAPYSLLNPK